MLSTPDYYNSNIYNPPPQFTPQPRYMYESSQFLLPNAPAFYPVGLEQYPQEFPSLSQPKPPVHQAEEFFPPGFGQTQPPKSYQIPNLNATSFEEKPRLFKAPNPNAVSFVPSNIPQSPPPPPSPPPIPSKDEEELIEYGVRGILSLQKNATSDIHMLARGRDLTKLGLNMKASENLASTLYSVMQDGDLDPSEQPEFTLPSCYLINKPQLKIKTLSLLSFCSLFYMFYNMPGELMQALSAEELYRRD